MSNNGHTSVPHLTVREAMRLTGYHQVTIYGLISNGRIKSIKRKFGEIVIHLIDRASLLEYCRQQERPVNEEA